MAHQLWLSQKTGIQRKGTTFKELQSLFIDKITTDLICEPIYSCKLKDSSMAVQETMQQKEFDIIGVINNKNEVVGFVKRYELTDGLIEDKKHPIELNKVISNNTPIARLLEILENDSFSFVMFGNKIEGIVTRADINKPIVRIYLFGLVSLFEMHLNFWINEFFKDEDWETLLNDERHGEASKIYTLRKGKNQDLTLLECIQLSDKKVILKSSADFLKTYVYSKSKFENIMHNAEKIRNELTHSQNSIISNLEWLDFVKTISEIEQFLIESEHNVQKLKTIPSPEQFIAVSE